MLYGQKVLGQLKLSKCGLYYEVLFRCSPQKKALRLVDDCDEGEVSIGICAPIVSGFGVNRKIPIKKLGTGNHAFRLIPVETAESLEFYELSEDRPCKVLPLISYARFTYVGGKPGLRISRSHR